MKLPTTVDVESVRRHMHENPVQALQILTIILGIVDVGFTSHSFEPWPDEEFFLAMTVISLIFSLGVFIGSRVYISQTTQTIDMTINLVVGAILGVSAFIMLISAIQQRQYSGFLVTERVIAAVVGLINAFVFGIIGMAMLKELQNSIFPITYKNSFVIIDWDRLRKTKFTGKLQVLAILLGVVDLGMTAHSYYRRSEEGLFLTIVATCFMFSTIELVGSLLGFIKTAEFSAYVVLAVAHSVAGLLLVSGGTLMIVSVTIQPETCTTDCNNSTYDERVVCGILGIVNGCLYALIAYCWYSRARKSDHVPSQYEWDYEDMEPLIDGRSSEENRPAT